MREIRTFCLWVVFATSAFADVGIGDSYYTLEAGDVRTIDVTDVERVAVGNPDIVNYKVLDNGQLLIIAGKTGITSVQVWRTGDRMSRLHFDVREAGTSRNGREIREMLKNIRGITITEINGHLIVEGKASKADIQLIDKIAQSTGGMISLVKEEEFSFLPLLRVDVKIVELSRKTADQLGIKWDASAGGPAVGVSTAMAANPLYSITSTQEARIPGALTAFNGTTYPPRGDSHFYGYAGITSSLGSQIDLMAQTGEARLLAAPKLVSKSGEEAHFLSGGSFPVQTISELGQPSITFQEYGIQLDIKPVVDDKGRINTNIHAEVSSLDFSVAINGVPGLLSRKVESVVNVNDNDAIVISGLASSQSSKQVSKVPFLGDLPVVGGLFKSTGHSDQQTELVILLTPHIVFPGDQRDESLRVLGEKMIDDGFLASKLNSALME